MAISSTDEFLVLYGIEACVTNSAGLCSSQSQILIGYRFLEKFMFSFQTLHILCELRKIYMSDVSKRFLFMFVLFVIFLLYCIHATMLW